MIAPMIGTTTNIPATHRGRTGAPIDSEPEFDRDRVVWDIRYRRIVMSRLKQWRERNRSSGWPEVQTNPI